MADVDVGISISAGDRIAIPRRIDEEVLRLSPFKKGEGIAEGPVSAGECIGPLLPPTTTPILLI